MAADPEFEPLPPLDDVDAGFEPLPSLQEETASQDAQLSATFKASLQTAPERKAGVLKLAKDTLAPADVVEKRYDEFKQTWEAAQFDPAKWRTENPELAKIALDHPELGQVVIRDQPLSVFSKAWNKALDFFSWADEAMAPFRVEGEDSPEAAAQRAQNRAADRAQPKQQALLADNKAKAVQDASPLERMIVPVLRYQETAQQMEISKLQFQLLQKRALGQDTYELEKRILDSKREAVQRDYGEGPVEQVLTDVAQAVASNVAVLKDASVGAVAMALGVGIPTAVVLKSPKAGLDVGLKAARFGGAAGMAYGSLQLEAGSTYGDLLETKTDDGKFLTEEEARGGALLYGAMAAAVEVASLPQLLRTFGPIGEALRTGERKAAFTALMRDDGFRQILKRVGKEWLKEGLTEGREEYIQSVLEDVTTYVTRSKSQGTWQKGPIVDFEKANMSAQKGGLGGLGVGLAGSAVHLTTEALLRDRTVAAGRQAAAIVGLADSPTAKAAPEVVAELIKRQSEQTGEAVTHLYVDPAAFTRLFQSENADPREAARTLLGEDGAKQLLEARVTGGKLEIPVATYLEKFGGSEAAKHLAEDTTTSPGLLTPRQLQAQTAEIEAQAKAIAEQVKKEEPTGAEAQFADALAERMKKQLEATGTYDEKKAATAVEVQRAFFRTMAKRSGIDPQVLFGDLVLEVQQGDNAPTGALMQPGLSPSAQTEQLLAEHFKGRGELQHRDYWTDINTGLYNERAATAMPLDPSLPYLAEVDLEGKKAANDLAGHSALDAMLRAGAQAIHGLAPWAAKVGGSIVFPARDEAHAKKLIREMQARMPDQRIRVWGSWAKRVEGQGLRETLDAIGAEGKKNKDAARAEGKFANRGDAPVAFLPRDEKGRPIQSPKDAEGKVVVPAEVAKQWTEALQTLSDIGRLPDDAFPLAPELRQASGMLSPEEMAREVFHDKETGLLTLDGWERTRELAPKAAVASIDMALLRDLDQAFGREATDRLIAYFGRALAEHGDLDPARLHGDEYAAQHDDPQLLRDVLGVIKRDLANVVFFLRRPDGSVVLQRGVYFGAGVAADFKTADGALLAADKAEVKKHAVRPEVIPADRAAEALAGLPADAVDLGAPVPELGRLREGPGPVDHGGPGGQGAQADQRSLGEPSAAGQAGGGGPTRLEQPSGAGPRGYTEVFREGMARVFKVALNKNADLSTFLHESGHVFLELFSDLAERSDAPDQVKADYAQTLQWLGVADRQEIKREHHEKWARAFEAYLMEGKAPSAKLEGAFARMKFWLKNVYRSLESLNVDLNDDVRGVFSRLLATDAELERGKRAMGLEPLFRSPEEAGMSPAQWQAYLDDQEMATSHGSRAAERRALKERLRATEDWWKEEEAKHRDQAEAEYEQLPARQAQQYLRGKHPLAAAPISLDRSAVEQAVGVQTSRQFLLRKGGENPDSVADVGGFPTGAEMLKAIAALPQKDVWVLAQVRDRMAQAHPDIVSQREELRASISKGLHSEYTARWLLREWAALKARARFDPETGRFFNSKGFSDQLPPVEAIMRAAKLLAEGKTVRKLDAGGSLQAERSAAEKAAKAAATGNYAQAAVYKQQQLLNLYLNRELGLAQEQRQAFEDRANELAEDKARARLGKAGPVYRGGVDLILEAFKFKAPEPNPERPLPSVSDVVAAMQGDGATVMFDQAELERLLTTKAGDWKDLTVGELRIVDTALKNIKGAATAKATAILDGKRVDRAELVDKLVMEAQSNLPPGGPIRSSESARGPLEKLKDGWTAFDGSLLKPETIFRGMLGAGDLDSIWFRAIVQPLQEAKAREVDLLERTIKPIIHAFEAVPASVRRSFMDKVDGAALFPTHAVSSGQQLSPPTRRFELLMMALNAGNASNLQRLLDGRNINEQQLRGALDLLTKEELDWVQSIWDAAESLRPEAFALEERDSGLAPPRIEPKPLQTKHGTYPGGYFPAAYDRAVEQAGERQQVNAIADILDQSFTRPGTPHSHLKSRVEEFAGALSLEPATIARHLAQVAHDIAFREALRSVGGLLLDPKVSAVMKDRVGDGRSSQFLGWLKDIGQMRAAEGYQRAAGLMKLMRTIRGNTVIAALGYAIPNAIEDLSNLPAALARTELKAKHLAASTGQFLASPMRSITESMAKSGELRTRHAELQRELQKQIRSLTASGQFARGPLRWMKDHAFVFMEFSDKATSTPVWMGAYRQAVAEGKSEADAVTFADVTVRQVFPSHSAVDAAPILRDKGFIGTSLMFYGFLSTYYNGIRELVHPLVAAEDFKAGARALPRVGGRLVAYMVAVGVLSEFLRGRGREGDEDWGQWFLRKLLAGGMSAFPYGGDLANAIEGGILHKRTNPRVVSLPAVAIELGQAIAQLPDDEKEADAKVKALLRALGPMMGIPTVQPMRTGTYLEELMNGDREARNPADFLGGVIYGERDGQPVNPASAIGDAISGER